MAPKRTRSTRLFRLSALVGATALVGLSLAGPAYAAKPDPPPGQSARATQNSDAGTPAKAPAKQEGETQAQSRAQSHATSGTAATNGSVSDPQPASSADFTGHGANAHGSYDSTRDGSESLNGNGNGKSTGKPCAGCVGKADNKNPRGQYPDGSDHNKGYECEPNGNHGIGRSNPAHTACTPSETTVTCPEGTTGTPPDCITDETDECVAGQTGVFPVCVPVTECPAGMEGTPPSCTTVSPPGGGETPPGGEVSPPSGEVSPPSGQAGPPAAAGSTATSSSPSAGSLPQTGAPSALVLGALAGLILLAGGALLTGRTKDGA